MKEQSLNLKWLSEGMCVVHAATGRLELGKIKWQRYEQRRLDASLCLFFNTVHGLVAVFLTEYKY